MISQNEELLMHWFPEEGLENKAVNGRDELQIKQEL